MNKYHIYQQEAKGKYSTIFKARKKKKLQFVAIKRMEKTRKKKILNQAKILSQLTHPNVIKFHDFMETKNHMWSVTQYCPGGDLLKLIQQDKALPQNIVKNFICEVLKGLQYCHSKAVIICDLKPASILINEYGKIKIADFGSAKTLIDLMNCQNQPKKGTPCYMAPELFAQGGQYSIQSDLWAVGCIMYELVQGNPPFVSSSLHEIQELAKSAQTPKAEFCSSDFNELLDKLLKKKWSDRISWNQLVKHRWFQGQLQYRQIPDQPHLSGYSTSQHMLSSQKVMDNEKYGSNTGQLNSKNIKNQQYIFGNDEQRVQQYIQPEQKFSLNVEDDTMLKNAFKKDKAGTSMIPVNNRHNIPQINDSSDMNLFIQTISRKNLLPFSQVLHHQSDNSVKPIIGNKDIEVIESFSFNKKALGFSYIDPETLADGIPNGQMDSQLKKILDGMTGQQKYNVLGYFQTIIQNSDVANFLFKPNFIPFYIKLIKGYKQAALRAKICEILGFLIRHATVIDSDVLKHGIINILLQTTTKDKSQKVRRKAMAALGQLLFYGATQVDEKITVWDIPTQTIHSILKILKNSNEDQIVRIYCCKSVQNITAQARQVGIKFAQIDTLMVLISCFNTTRNEGFRNSILSCLHHIIQLNSSLTQIFVQKVGTTNVIATFKSPQTNIKSIQILLWVYNYQLSKAPNSKISRALYEDQTLLKAILNLLEINSPIIRGRVYLYIYFLVTHNIKKALVLCDSKLFILLDKQHKQSSKYQAHCLQYVLVVLFQNYSQFIKLTIQDIKQATILSKNISLPLGSDSYTRKNVSFIQLIHHLATCPIFQQLFDNTKHFQQLASLLNYLDSASQNCKTVSPYLQHIKSSYIQLLQKFMANSHVTQKLQEQYATSFMPYLVGKILKSTQNDIRFNCMKFLLFLVSFYMSQQYLYDSTVLSSTSNKIVELINEHLLPQIDYLLQQGETVSTMTLKLLAVLFQISDIFARKFYELGKIQYILKFYTQQSSINVLKIIRSLVINDMMEFDDLKFVLPVTQKILFHYTNTGQDLFLQYPLQILEWLIKKNICPQESLDKIWEVVIPLQAHEDIVVREKSENLIETCLKLQKYSIKGKWEIRQKKGLENYENFIKMSGRQSDPKIIAPFKAKTRYS